jgi:hypothetical protein
MRGDTFNDDDDDNCLGSGWVRQALSYLTTGKLGRKSRIRRLRTFQI